MSLTPPAISDSEPRADDPRVGEDLPKRWVRVRWCARALFGVVFTAWSLLLIAWLTLHWGILPHIQQWREPIEQRASRALGVPVRIGQIEVRSKGWVPSFELRDVELLGADQRPALRLPRVVAAISPRSLLSLQLRFVQLLIDGAELEVRRDASGHIFVGGLAVGATGTSENSEAADWFFAQREFVIRGGSLRWIDEMRSAAPLALGDVQLIVRNGLRTHDIRIDATPPPDWGDRFTLSGRFTQPLLQRGGDWRHWSGSAYLSLPRADTHELRQHVSLPFELDEGVGALRAWVDVRNGEPVGATADIALRAMTLRLAADVEPLRIEEFQGRVVANRTPLGLAMAARHVSFLTGDNIRWPEGDMTLTLRQRSGQPVSGGEFGAQHLDLGLIAQIASRVPLGDAVRKLLADLAPQGSVSGLSAQWDGALDAPAHYHVKGDLAGLALAARPAAAGANGGGGGVGRPGLRNASIKLDASDAGGSAQLAIDHGDIDLPGVFDERVLPLDQLNAQLQWTIAPSKTAGEPPRLGVQVRNAHFANPDAKGELTAAWSTGAGAGTGLSRGGRFPGHLELDAKLSNGRVERTYRYLPTAIPRPTRDYLQHALQAGDLVSAGFHVKGDLWEFPFTGAKTAKGGEFRITAHVENARYAYLPNTPATPSTWPVLNKVAVDVGIDRDTLTLDNGQAQVGNLELRGVQGAIVSLESDARLAIETSARGPLAEMLRVVTSTPVNGWIGKALEASTGSGNAELKLALDIPLLRAESSTVKGSVTLAGNDVRITPGSPLLGAATGRVDFSNKSLAIVGARARVYGGDLAFDGGLQPDGSLRFNGQGTASADGLKRASELGQGAKLAGVLSGQTGYRVNLGFVHGEPELSVTSNLVGLAIDLPAPLAKAAETPLALRVQRSLEPAATGPPQRDTLRLELGNILQAQYQRDISGETPRVLRGGIGVMEPAPQPASGVSAGVNLKLLATDPWEAVADKLLGPAGRDSAAAGEAAGYAPDAINLRVDELDAGPRRLTHVSAGLSQDANGRWRANLDADQLAGYIEYRPPSRRGAATGGAGRVYARLTRASLPKSEDEQVESLLDQQPSAMPALDVVIEDFELRGKHLGRVEIEAVNRATPQGRDWQLTKLDVTTPEAQLSATGHWSLAARDAGARDAGALPPRRMVMDFKLALSDSGALLERLGTPKVFRGGKGALSGQVGWNGSPFSLDYPSLAGQIKVAIDAGQFLKAEPGAARLLGVLSLQSLPRRLSLDFRDVFQEGFAFDNITGDVGIAQGVAHTNNLRMRGVQAVVLMEGNADIAHETQDLRVVVVPEINAGTAALAYAVINPAIGLGAFLAQALLKKPLTEAGTREFHVSGSWADPKVDKVDRKFGDDVPNADVPASAASAPVPAPASVPGRTQ
ncbi:MAG TPA: YhdP family protein [Burkholderiaceae bacterium]|jgi:uncharacterized protein (TIGR02099 family)